MSLTNERKKEQKARDVICKALNDLDGAKITIPDFSERNIRDCPSDQFMITGN